MELVKQTIGMSNGLGLTVQQIRCRTHHNEDEMIHASLSAYFEHIPNQRSNFHFALVAKLAANNYAAADLNASK
jgi:hypothetical protein